MESVIQVKNLVKSYGNKKVLRGLSFAVQQGEALALLGANGAGKTTTLECLEGIRRYDSGEIHINNKIGVQLQSSTLPENIRPAEAVKLFSKWNSARLDQRIFKSLGLDRLEKKQYRELSTGQKRRLHLALAMIGNPDILFLDEPTAGLDVEGRAALHEEIRAMSQAGKTILLASHDMAEVETLCDRIIILKDGQTAFSGTPNEITLEMGSKCRLHVKISSEKKPGPISGCTFIGEKQGYSIYEATDIQEGLEALLEKTRVDDMTICDLKIERASLEQRFMDIAREGA